MSDQETVTVYVRKGSTDEERRLAFAVPERMDQGELLERGIAIDGDQALFAIYGAYETSLDSRYEDPGWAWYGPFVSPDPKPGQPFDGDKPGDVATLPDALREAQVRLREFLG